MTGTAPIRVLIVDNFDSFTYNIAQCVSAITGEMPVVRHNDQIDWDEIEAAGFDRIILSPGPGTPENPDDFGIGREILAKAQVPVLGVCLGHQGIGLEFGASIAHAPEPLHGRVWRVHHDGDILFSGIPESFEATRYHSLMVRRPLPDCLEEIAWTGDGILMGLRHRTRPYWGVQFHPESIGTPWGARLIENFLRLDQSTTGAKGRTEGRSQAATDTAQCDGAPADLRLFHRIVSEGPIDECFFERAFGHSADRFWLDSSSVDGGRARFSYMGDASGPRAQQFRFARTGEDDHAHAAAFARSLSEAARSLRTPPISIPFEFVGGLVGYFGYEFRGGVEPDARFATRHPDAQFILADRFVAIDHHGGAVHALHIGTEAEADAIHAWIDEIERLARAGTTATADPPTAERIEFRLHHCREAYLDLVRRSLGFIRDGVSYEICLTNRMNAAVRPEPHALYRRLRARNPAPYAAFLSFPGVDVLSSSPECFLKLDRLGNVTAKPIKGTIRRSKDPIEDAALAARLRSSEKDRAENLMIVDLLRNDLGRVCELGSVHVPELMQIESYATVHQLVTTISGRLAPGNDFIDCLSASFPGGSMTGAPKTRTLALIEELEAIPRGIYSGAMGFIGADGAAEMSIVIRTIVLDDGGCSIGIGGAIVAASEPAAEFDETMLKGKALVEAIAECVTGDPQAYDIVAASPAGARQRVT